MTDTDKAASYDTHAKPCLKRTGRLSRRAFHLTFYLIKTLGTNSVGFKYYVKSDPI